MIQNLRFTIKNLIVLLSILEILVVTTLSKLCCFVDARQNLILEGRLKPIMLGILNNFNFLACLQNIMVQFDII